MKRQRNTLRPIGNRRIVVVAELPDIESTQHVEHAEPSVAALLRIQRRALGAVRYGRAHVLGKQIEPFP